MRLPGFRLLPLFIVAALAFLAPACSTIDRPIEDGIGTVVVFFVNPALQPPRLNASTVSAAEWNVIRSEIIVDGVPYDMGLTVEGVIDDPADPDDMPVDPVTCIWADTSRLTFPQNRGPCASGRVFPAVLDASSIRLELEVELRAYRTMPLFLDPMDDEDGDMVLNEDDNCPLIPNEPQVDIDGNGRGDVCELTLFTPPIPDEDGDNFELSIDRCPWLNEAVPDADPIPVSTALLGVDTGTSDSDNGETAVRPCVPQDVLVVDSAGRATFVIERDIEDFFRVSTLDTTNLVVDFDLENTLASCDWGSGTCVVPPTSVKTCIQRGLISALSGCPD